MNKLRLAIIKQSQELRRKKLFNMGKLFLRFGISANLITLFSFVMGVLAIYYLFTNQFLFILFTILHLIGDGLDGVIAKVAKKETKQGYLLDHLSDRVVALLNLLKLSFFFGGNYMYLVSGLFVLTQSIHLIGKFKYPAIYVGSTIMIIMMFNFSPLNNFLNVPVIAFSTAGVLSVCSLLLQLRYFLKK